MSGRQTKIVEVREGEYTTIPHDKHVLAGPAKLEVTRYPDGRVTGLILTGEPLRADKAIKRNLTKITWGI